VHNFGSLAGPNSLINPPQTGPPAVYSFDQLTVGRGLGSN